MTDDQARMFLAELRWGSIDQQVCPECGVADRHYNIRSRRQWRCKHCFHTFSVTSGTSFADRKIWYRKLVLVLFAFVINQKGLAALALRRIIGSQYRTSFTLLHKLREAIMTTTSQDQLEGVVEIDGGHLIAGKASKARDFTNRRSRFAGIVDEAVRAKNRNKSKILARVEHVFGVIKRLWGFGKVRHCDLQNNVT